ncbi:hypothetical protein [Celeribacter sp.]|uniref:hypothetical protein n=1 Tax=Celeribacter sp. TaxID=1890673 RepID=UPI003A8EB9F7
MKVLVIGTSHSATIRMAHDEIAARFPTLDVDYFGLPGREFFQADVIGTTFTPQADARKIAFEWNNTETVDLAHYDHLFVVGDRYGLLSILRLLVQYDTLEEGKRRGGPVMSRAAMTALIEGAVSHCVDALVARFGRFPHVTTTPAPYPLKRSWRPGAGHERHLTELTHRAHAEDWIEVYENAIEQQVTAAGIGFVPQPLETRYDAFRTLNRFARARSTAEGTQRIDNRHMNADFGALLFETFARDILDIHPAAAQKSADEADG